MRSLSLALALAALAACSRRGDEGEKARLFAREAAGKAAGQAFDPASPAASLAMDADEAARRIGTFEWTAGVDWTVTRGGDDAGRVHAAETHVVRQAANGEFEVDAEIDPGLGAGSESGRRIVYAGGTTYARSRYAPAGAFRARENDRGRDARRFRDESFRIAADLAALYGRALAIEPAGDGEALGRPAKRYRLALAPGEAPPAPPAGRTFAANGPDEDTRRHLAFLEGGVPLEATGELLADAATGVPLRVHLKGALGVKDDPKARARFEVVAQVKALGTSVAAVAVPRGALPDVGKPPGVAGALQAAGLKKQAEQKGGEEPGEEE